MIYEGQKSILTEKATNEHTGRTEQLQRYDIIKDIGKISKEKESQQVKTSNSSPAKTAYAIL